MSTLLTTNKGIPRTGRVIRGLAQLLGYHQGEPAATAVAYNGSATGAALDPETKPIRHRLRVFHYESEKLEPGDTVYVEVWDTTEEPLASEDLPAGKPVFEFTDVSLDNVEQEADRFCQSLAHAEIVNWRDLCSI